MDKSPLHGEFSLSSQPSNTSITETGRTEQTQTGSGHTFHALAHFVQNPDNFSFEAKNSEEDVVLVLRSHIIVNVPWVLFTLVLLLIPLLLILVLPNASIIRLDLTTKVLLTAVYYLIVFGYAFLNFTLWYFQATIITNQRIIDIDLNGILSLQINEAPIESVLDSEYRQKGMLASFFDYGDILLETETRVQDLEIIKAPHPTRAVEIISKLVAAKGGHE